MNAREYAQTLKLEAAKKAAEAKQAEAKQSEQSTPAETPAPKSAKRTKSKK